MKAKESSEMCSKEGKRKQIQVLNISSGQLSVFYWVYEVHLNAP